MYVINSKYIVKLFIVFLHLSSHVFLHLFSHAFLHLFSLDFLHIFSRVFVHLFSRVFLHLFSRVFQDSSAARNGMLTDHYLVEVDGQNIVGLSDNKILKVIQSKTNSVTVTIMPEFVYDHMVRIIYA